MKLKAMVYFPGAPCRAHPYKSRGEVGSKRCGENEDYSIQHQV